MKKIYTKTGDKGQTSLYGGKRVLKSDLRIENYGSVDELNSVLGVVIAEIEEQKVNLLFERSENYLKSKNFSLRSKNNTVLVLRQIQKDLLFIGSLLAGYKSSKQKINSKQLEEWIDNFEKELPALRNFILPGGTETGSLLHLARSICRRAERRVVELSQKENIDKEVIIYLNRLSDLLFVMARVENLQAGKKEIIWKNNN